LTAGKNSFFIAARSDLGCIVMILKIVWESHIVIIDICHFLIDGEQLTIQDFDLDGMQPSPVRGSRSFSQISRSQCSTRLDFLT
jgi:hypothetical protein